MKTPLLLLLTNDPTLEDDSGRKRWSEHPRLSHLTTFGQRRVANDLRRGADLDLAVIDFEHGSHALSLLSVVTMRRKNLPLIVITGDHGKHVAALAYACGASACLHKPVTTAEIVAAIKRFCRLNRELALVA